jgi:hypothetical protein
LAQRVVCGTNLAGIVKAMMVYANDDESGRLPRAGYRDGLWAEETPAAGAPLKNAAFGAPGANPPFIGGEASICASLYLLVKFDYTSPKQFNCRSDPAVEAFQTGNPTERWDFGDENHGAFVSYAYHMPYSFGSPLLSFGLTAASEPGMAVVADRSPWFDPTADTVGPPTFAPTGDEKAKKIWNSELHQKDGQNVTYVDTHTEWQKYSFVGLNDDNIYTMAFDGQEPIRGGTPPSNPPATTDGPFNKFDSVLISGKI